MTETIIKQAKPHRVLLQAIVGALTSIFEEGKYADKVIEKVLKENTKFGGRDRRYVADATYGIVRNYRLLNHIADNTNDYWKILGNYILLQNNELPEISEFDGLSKDEFNKRIEGIKEQSVLQSYPDWLWELAEAELGKNVWEKEAIVLNEQAKVVLRVNTIKTNKEKLLKQLIEAGIEVENSDEMKDALQLTKRQNLFQNELFKKGLFEIQDAGSQLISEFLQVKSGMSVIDACAGAGGKSLHLAAIMRNEGRIIAMDITQWKLDELKKRAERAEAKIIIPKLIDGNKTIENLSQSADRLLLDVPCSGTGVIKRNPDTKWKLNKESLEETRSLQKTILKDYSEMLKVGGEMVYSTCSILPSENQNQVAEFLKANNNFELITDKTILPSEGFDGFYMARLKRLS